MKRAAAAGAVTLGVAGATGSAVARSAPASRERAEALLAGHGDEVLSMLERDGVLEDRDALPTDVGNDIAGVAMGHEGAAKLSLSDGTEQIRVVKEVEAGTLTVTVAPDEERSFAILETDDGIVGYNVEQGVYDFEAQAECNCTYLACNAETRQTECCGEYDCTYLCGC